MQYLVQYLVQCLVYLVHLVQFLVQCLVLVTVVVPLCQCDIPARWLKIFLEVAGSVSQEKEDGKRG